MFGLYYWDNSIFDKFALPDGVDKSVLVDNLLLECADLEVLYPDPAVLKAAIGSWSSAKVASWQRLQDALAAEYNPIENYDRHETWTDSTRGNALTRVAGYNGGAMADADSAENSGNATHSGNVHGNIGVTTAQQMITEEIKLRTEQNITDIIIDQFKKRFCLLIY